MSRLPTTAGVAGDVTRRDFLAGGVAAGVVAGGSLGAFYFGYGKASGKPLRVGVLGTGDQGGVLIGAVNPAYLQVCSIADIRPYNVYRAFHGDHSSPADAALRPGLMKKLGWKTEDKARKKVKVYDATNDGYKGLIDHAKADGVEAVIIALPLHLHAEAAIAAMEAGLHVFCEPLMAQTVLECKKMAQAAQTQRRLLAVGHQRHYNLLYENAADAIRRGKLGEVHYIRAQYHRSDLPGQDAWQPPLPPEKSEGKSTDRLAEELEGYQEKLAKALAADPKKKDKAALAKEIDLWTMLVAQKNAQLDDRKLYQLAKDFGYQEHKTTVNGKDVVHPAIAELLGWRLWNRTSAGLMAELGVQQLDAAALVIAAAHGGEPQRPLSIAAVCNRPVFPADREIEDHVACVLEYPAPGYYDPQDPAGERIADRNKRVGVQYAILSGNGFGGYGEIVFGSKGTYILEKEQEWAMSPTGGGTSTVKTAAAGGATLNTQASGAQGPITKSKDQVSMGFTEELEHWAWCIRNPARENQPRCGAEVGLANAVVALTANVAARQARRIEFKKEWFDPQSDATPDA